MTRPISSRYSLLESGWTTCRRHQRNQRAAAAINSATALCCQVHGAAQNRPGMPQPSKYRLVQSVEKPGPSGGGLGLFDSLRTRPKGPCFFSEAGSIWKGAAAECAHGDFCKKVAASDMALAAWYARLESNQRPLESEFSDRQTEKPCGTSALSVLHKFGLFPSNSASHCTAAACRIFSIFQNSSQIVVSQ